MTVSLFRLDGTGTVVVGAGSGIGAAVARGCAEHGAYVTCLDLDGDKAAQTAESIRNAGGEADGAVLDIRDGSAVDEALANVLSRGGSVDAVISTPGINVRKPLLRYSDEEFDRVVDLNLKGTMHVLQSAGRLMAAAGAGSIIVFSSIRSLVVEPDRVCMQQRRRDLCRWFERSPQNLDRAVCALTRWRLVSSKLRSPRQSR